MTLEVSFQGVLYILAYDGFGNSQLNSSAYREDQPSAELVSADSRTVYDVFVELMPITKATFR